MSGVGILAREWSWQFATRPVSVPDGVTLTIDAGEVILLAGPSGSGKSTFLAALAGVLGSDQGRARGDLRVGGQPPRAGSGLAGLVLQDPESQTIRETVGDDVAFGCESLGLPREQIWKRVDEALDVVGLHVPRDHPSAHLSGGQKQRLAIAGVIAMSPQLLLLDEPTANLDPEGAAGVVAAVTRIATETGCTIVVVDHNAHLWRELATRVVALDIRGRVVDDRAPFPASRRALEADAPAERVRFSGEAVLESVGLTVRRPGGTGIAMPDVHLQAGRVLALTGPNGCGKTTLALTLGGLVAPAGGAMTFSERVNAGLPKRQRDEPWRWSSRRLAVRVGSVFQNPELQFVRHTVRDELAWGARMALRGDRSQSVRRVLDTGVKKSSPATDFRNDVDDVLHRLRLAHLVDAHPYTLSGGEQRRLSLAAVLMSRPHIVIADEPSFGQDDDTWLETARMLRESAERGTAVLIATHDRDLCAVADVVINLPARGREVP